MARVDVKSLWRERGEWRAALQLGYHSLSPIYMLLVSALITLASIKMSKLKEKG